MDKDTKIDELMVRVPDGWDSEEKDTMDPGFMDELRRRASQFYRGESVGEDWQVVMARVFERLRAGGSLRWMQTLFQFKQSS